MSSTFAPPAPPAAVTPPAGNTLQLLLATTAFAVCFAVFGSVAAMMPLLAERLHLSEGQIGLALALPVLLGSLGRILLGILTDRLGGRRVFLASMAVAFVPVTLLGWVDDYVLLLLCGFFVGVALAVFPIGVAMVNGWYPPQRQGTALGIYGAGNIGQALAAFGAPLIARQLGYPWGFWFISALLAVWLVVFAALARDAPTLKHGPARGWGDFLKPLRNGRSWLLSLYYFLTFGGFVAMASYLPLYLRNLFGLDPIDAGLRTAGFVLLATAMRPVGGWLADRVGGRTVLLGVFPTVIVAALFLAFPSMGPFTAGALIMATAIGLGNGAVFKLVPEYFPGSVGSVTGLVGAAGGLGGFFPPLVVGVLYQVTGRYGEGFFLLALFALGCLVLCWWSGRAPQMKKV